MNLDPELADLLRGLVWGRGTGSLATLHEGRPSVSMVPVAAATAGGRLRFVIHVSGLAAHTRDMRSCPDVCLMIVGPESATVPLQARPRVSISGRAEFIAADHPDHDALESAYLGAFPEAAELFAFADFSLVAIDPTSARFVAGFARAMTLAPAVLAGAVGIMPRATQGEAEPRP